MSNGLSATMALAAFVALSDPAHGFALSRTAESGKSTLMYEYGNWKADCSSHGGVVKVLSKPQHGKLSPVRQAVTIKRSRFARDMSCVGRQIQGFVVYYTPAATFRGTDRFSIEVTYPGRPPDIDTFTVQVR